jgi:hypothetical protein
VPDIPDLSRDVAALDVPLAPDVPEAPDEPEAPDALESRDAPEDEGEVSDDPAVPDWPAAPAALPAVALSPAIPDVPDEPEEPAEEVVDGELLAPSDVGVPASSRPHAASVRRIAMGIKRFIILPFRDREFWRSQLPIDRLQDWRKVYLFLPSIDTEQEMKGVGLASLSSFEFHRRSIHTRRSMAQS